MANPFAQKAIDAFSEYERYRMEIEDDGAPPADGIVFVTGHAGSGTSGICNLLSAHPEAFVANEAYWWQYTEIPATREFYTGPNPVPIHHHRFAEAAGREWSPVFKASDVQRYLLAAWNLHLPDTPVKGDKSTALYPRVRDDLENVFPGCRWIYTTRDKYDLAASLMDKYWWPRDEQKKRGKPFESQRELAEHALSTIDASLSCYDWIVKDPEKARALVVPFEGLADEPEPWVERMIEHVGLDPGDYPMKDGLSRVHYAEAAGHWKQIPALLQLRKEACL